MIQRVDQSKCIGCGTCQRICPLDVFRLDVKQDVTSPCSAACPIPNDIRSIHYQLQMGSIEGAARMMLDNNPLASVTGRICPRFCESECTRKNVDAAVNISAIEQYLGDHLIQDWVDKVPRRHAAPVAVVGAGPAGLSCAYFLAADGFQVTLFEAKDEPGGMLRYAIPEYRLPSAVIDPIISRLKRMGVTIKCNHALNDAFSLDDLQAQGFRAVFLGLGAGKAKQLKVEGAAGEAIFSGLDFLKGVRTGRIANIGSSVAVVGGGDVAMDAAQTARRMGARSVTLIALEGEKDLPAYRHNTEAARAEGIDFFCSLGVGRIAHHGSGTKTIDLVKCVCVYDEKGNFAPKFDAATCSQVTANTLILAIGQEVDPASVPAGLASPQSLIKAGSDTCQTSAPGVFAAGDAVTGPASVAQAIGGGKRAAQAIMLHLRGIELVHLPPGTGPVFEGLPEEAAIERSMRHERKPFYQPGANGFAELYRGFGVVEAMAEADRCLTCGAKSIPSYLDDCMTCFNCEINCPTEAIFVHPFKEILPRSLRPIEG